MTEHKISGFDTMINQIRDQIKEQGISTSGKGNIFERLVKQYLIVCPPYSEMYEEVWLWADFPYNNNVHDTGIDIVAKKKNCDEYVAVQCKFYEEDKPISMSDINKFLATSEKHFYVDGKKCNYTERIFVSTTDKWAKNAEDAIKNLDTPVSKIGLQDLRNSVIDWDQFSLDYIQSMKPAEKKNERDHQKTAREKVIAGFKTADRGKLIMACGTGKTFTSLKIAEEQTNGNGSVLFLVPSISLLNQTLQEWCAQCSYDYSVFAICSDPKASRKTDDPLLAVIDATIPASTNSTRLVESYEKCKDEPGMKLFFSTYQSIDVISRFQDETDLVFDLIICDEAHRTTGFSLTDNKSKGEESDFVKVHDNNFIRGKKRLYMTATPRIYTQASQELAERRSVILCSMDKEEYYGKEFYKLSFADAVGKNLLSDYRVVVLAVDEEYASSSLQEILTDENNELKLDDSVKILGCLNGLSKRTMYDSEKDYFTDDPEPMKCAVAFAGTRKVSEAFVENTRMIQDALKKKGNDEGLVNVELDHVDGTMNVADRSKRLDWLKDDIPDGTCRVLSNPRCLSEGIDVPALDAVIFLNANKSKVDIIQAVGRVMRKAEGKKYGYVILPVGIPAGKTPSEVLTDNKKYGIIWEVLQALLSHDEDLNKKINQIELNEKNIDKIQLIGVGGTTDDGGHIGEDDGNEGDEQTLPSSNEGLQMSWKDLDEWKDAIYAKIVDKCGKRQYWKDWADDVADIAKRHMASINKMIDSGEITPRFNNFLSALRANLNPTITRQDAVEMLAEHMVTLPVFQALFEGYDFIEKNPVSKIMQDMINSFDDKFVGEERETLDSLSLKVFRTATGLDNSKAKQDLIKDLYKTFFQTALPDTSNRLGIVYTPTEVVDFIIQSVEVVLGDYFDSSINDKGVHILDPFTGTGTFIVQLLRSGLIKPENLQYKYQNELHANEIVLLAYYIAAINIEETYHDITKAEEYTPFDGIVLTDTFELSENPGKEYNGPGQMTMFKANSGRASKEMQTPITVIIGNPPYSVGQKSSNDNNQNIKYEHLDAAVANTYVAKSNAQKNKYDTYIKSFRWATDRLGNNGVICFVTNGSFIDSTSYDGMRQCLIEEFNSIYVFNLRGDASTKGERRRKEKGNVFGEGTKTPIAITLLIKKENTQRDGYVHYYDIGDYLTREQKLDIIKDFNDINGIKWKKIKPNSLNDWINQRQNTQYLNFTILGDKNENQNETYFNGDYALGYQSGGCDSWFYNFSSDEVVNNTNEMIAFCNDEVVRCNTELQAMQQEGSVGSGKKERVETLNKIRTDNETKIHWSDKFANALYAGKKIEVVPEYRKIAYRPFCKKYCAFDKKIIHRMKNWDNIFPTVDTQNLVICINGTGSKDKFAALITDCIQDFQHLFNCQSFPMYFYDLPKENKKSQLSFNNTNNENSIPQKRHTISDLQLEKFRQQYGENVSKEDIFYYIYAVLQNNEYIERYSSYLSKGMPCVPMLKGFKKYVKIGRELANLHLHYEDKVDPASVPGLHVDIKKENYYVKKMHFTDKDKKDTLIFNDYITISGIPKETFRYKLNGRSPLDGVIEYYDATKKTKSGKTDDPNTYSKDEKYILNLVISVIHLSLETQKLVDSMPPYEEI